MGQEIERARSLLASITREQLLSAEDASRAYEEWAASAGDAPFSRFLIDNEWLGAGPIRLQLRLLAVQGLAQPELHTYERFEDLILAQLALEADLVTPKIVKTVRMVQDKKLEEGKLRRLVDLLPRAGVDPSVLAMVTKHVRERLVICRGCLGRYPRLAEEPARIRCPRCDYLLEVAPDDLAGSGAPELRPSTKQRLLDSQERIVKTLPVAERMRPRATARHGRGASGGSPLLGGLLIAALLGLFAGGLYLLSHDEAGSPSPRRERVRRERDPTSRAGNGSPPSTLSLAQVQELESQLFPQGGYAELLSAWDRVGPSPGEDPAEVARIQQKRMEELRRLAVLSERVSRALEDALGSPGDPRREERLAQLLRESTGGVDFSAAVAELRRRRQARRQKAAEEATARANELREGPSSSDRLWQARAERMRLLQPSMRTRLGGKRRVRVQLTEVDETGFELKRAGGESQRFEWGLDPRLSLQVWSAMQPESRLDRLELLRFALLARDVKTARTTCNRLKLPASVLDPEGVIALALTSSLPERTSQGFRVSYPTRWPPHDLRPADTASVMSASAGLLLRGAPASLRSDPLQLAAGKVSFKAACELESSGEVHFSLQLFRPEGPPRSYRVSWGGQSWSLELDLGAGWNPLRSGSLPGQAHRARFELEGGRIRLYLDDVELAQTSMTAEVAAVSLEIGAVQEEVLLKRIHLEGGLDPAQLSGGEGVFQSLVELAMIRAAHRAAREGNPAGWPTLTVEDPQGLVSVDKKSRLILDEAKAALFVGRSEEALGLLAQLPGGIPVAHYYRALGALLQHDPSEAVRFARAALQEEPEFLESRGLLALALGRSHRTESARMNAQLVLEHLPDQVPAYLARFRWQLHERDVAEPLPWVDLREDLEVAQLQAEYDPLVDDELYALRLLHQLEEVCPTTTAGSHHVLRSAGGELSDLSARIDSLFAGLATALKGDRSGPALVFLPTPRQFQLLTGTQAQAVYDPHLGVLLLASSQLSGDDWDLARAAAGLHVAAVFGGGPPWLQSGLADTLAEQASGQPPPGYAESLAQAGSWGPSEWSRLFRQSRRAFAGSSVDQAKAWGLLEGFRTDEELTQALNTAREELAKGEVLDPSPFLTFGQ